MNKASYNLLFSIAIAFLFYSCLPDRMPSEPTETKRPEFAKFGEVGFSNLNVPLDSPLKIYFNEKMDLNTFPENFIVESSSGRVQGTFSYGEADTIVMYVPTQNYQPAEIYNISIKGGVRDVNHNSMIAPTEEDVPQVSWFFTAGNYSANGFPYVFVRDKTQKNLVYKVGDLNRYKDSLLVAGPEDYQTSSIEVNPNSDQLFMINLKATAGTVTVLDPATLSTVKIINVGLGPTNIEFTTDKAYLTNASEKSFSVINLSNLTTENTYVFSDGFRPKDVVYSNLTNKLYFYHNSNKTIKVVNADDYNDSHDLADILEKQPIDIEITNDGQYIFFVQSNSSKVVVLNAQSEAIASTIDFAYEFNVDGVVGKDAYYLAYFKGVGGDFVGGILKINLTDFSLTSQLDWPYEVDQMKLTASDELIYAVIPRDSTIKIVETNTMQMISEAKVNGSLKYLAVTKKNY